MRKLFLLFTFAAGPCGFFLISSLSAQLIWQNVDSLFQPLPASVHVYRSATPLDGKPNIAYYVEADLNDRKLEFTADTTFKRRLTPSGFYQKNQQPLVVVNTTFFSFATNQNLNVVIKDKRMVSYNVHTINGRGKDTFTYRHPLGSAIGISKKRKADIAWLFTDTSAKFAYAHQCVIPPIRDSLKFLTLANAIKKGCIQLSKTGGAECIFKKWKVSTAVGGGPVLIQNGAVCISNNEELKFAGKAIDDRHPRTAMGYTNNGKLIILVVQGRTPGIAEGATLKHEAQIFKDLGCAEALNLDGGGSSCLLVNGKETIKVSDAGGQRPVPAVFIIKGR